MMRGLTIRVWCEKCKNYTLHEVVSKDGETYRVCKGCGKRTRIG